MKSRSRPAGARSSAMQVACDRGTRGTWSPAAGWRAACWIGASSGVRVAPSPCRERWPRLWRRATRRWPRSSWASRGGTRGARCAPTDPCYPPRTSQCWTLSGRSACTWRACQTARAGTRWAPRCAGRCVVDVFECARRRVVAVCLRHVDVDARLEKERECRLEAQLQRLAADLRRRVRERRLEIAFRHGAWRRRMGSWGTASGSDSARCPSRSGSRSARSSTVGAGVVARRDREHVLEAHSDSSARSQRSPAPPRQSPAFSGARPCPSRPARDRT